MTPALRAKVFGLNAAKPYKLSPSDIKRETESDAVARSRVAYAEMPNPSFATYGPRTRREFLNLRQWHGAGP
jgi:hypothetical protein